MSNVMGYFNNTIPATPANPAYQAAPTQPTPVVVNTQPGYSNTPYYQGQQPVATFDSYVPTAVPEPYTSGIRTAGAAIAATKAMPAVVTQARWGHMLKGRQAAGLSNNIVSIKGANSLAKKQAYLNKQVLLKNQAKIARPGPFAALRRTFFSPMAIGRAALSSALVAVPMALITNFLDWRNGRITEEQRNTLFVADSLGYTATGTVATLGAAAIATTFLGGTFGTLFGIGAGIGLGWVYEKFIRPRWVEMVHGALYQQPSMQPQPTPAPQPTPPPQPQPVPQPQPPADVPK